MTFDQSHQDIRQIQFGLKMVTGIRVPICFQLNFMEVRSVFTHAIC